MEKLSQLYYTYKYYIIDFGLTIFKYEIVTQ